MPILCRTVQVVCLLTICQTSLFCVIAGEPKRVKSLDKIFQPFDDNKAIRTISPDGKIIAICHYKKCSTVNKNKTIKTPTGRLSLVNIATGKELLSIDHVKGKQKGIRGVPLRVAFSPNGKWLAVGSSGATIEECFTRGHAVIFNAKTGKLHREFDCADRQVRNVLFSRDSKQLVTLSGINTKHGETSNTLGLIRVWDIASGQQKHQLKLKDDVPNYIDFSDQNGKQLIALGFSDGNGVIKVFDLSSGKEKFQFKTTLNLTGGGSSVNFSPNGQFLIIGCDDNDDFAMIKIKRNPITIWSTATWKKLLEFQDAPQKRALMSTFSNDNRFLLTFFVNGKLVVRETKQWKIVGTKTLVDSAPGKLPDFHNKACQFFNDGRYLLIHHIENKKMQRNLWDLSDFLKDLPAKKVAPAKTHLKK